MLFFNAFLKLTFICFTFFSKTKNDAPKSHSLKNSNASPKMKTLKEEEVEVRSLTHNISGVEGHVGILVGRFFNNTLCSCFFFCVFVKKNQS